MKSIKLIAATLLVTMFSFAQKPEAKTAPAPIIPAPQAQTQLKFETETHDFGTIDQGKPATYEFSFVNNSTKEITIKSANASCGCTVPNYTKTAIKPGEKGFVSATYNAANVGQFNKSITVTTSEENTAPKIVFIKGTVNAPATTPVTK